MLFWLIGSSLVLADGQDLRVVLPQDAADRAELGRPLTATLQYRGAADLDRIQLAPWRADFAIDRGYTREEDGLQALTVRLTPRRRGELTLAPLQLGSARSASHRIKVAAAREDGAALVPQWTVSRRDAWQRQEIIAALLVEGSAPEARLEVGELRSQGFLTKTLPPQREALADGRVRHRFVWLLRPQRAGEHSLQPPVLRYVRDGVPKRRFHFPASKLMIRALPPYVPPTVPVGRLSRHLDDHGQVWVRGQGIDAADLTTALDWARLPHPGATEELATGGRISRARIDWPDRTASPARLLSFDPAIGRLVQLELAAPPRSPALWLLLPFGLLLVFVLWQWQRLADYVRRHRHRWRLLRRLDRVDDACAIKDALLAESGARTLDQWERAWCSGYRAPRGLSACLADLAAANYSHRAADAAALCRAASAVIAGSRPRW